MSPGPGRLDSVTRRRLFLSPLLLLVALLTGLGLNTSSASASAGPETRVRAINHVPAISVGNIDSETPGRVGYLRPETGQVMSGSCVATEAGGARFVAASDGAVTDLVGANPNAVVLGKYPAYVNESAATGARTFSMSDEAWNAMTPAQQWTRNQQFLDQAITRGSDIRLATPPTASNLTGWYAREIGYLTKQGYTISSDGARMIPPGG